MRRSWIVMSALVASISLVACGAEQASESPPTSEIPPTSTAEPSAPTTEEPVEGWDLLYISDSSGWKAGEAYAAHAEEALGIPVRLIPWRVPNLTLVHAKEMIEQDPEVVASAEIIVLWGNAVSSGVRFDGLAACVGDASPDAAFDEYTAEDWAPYTDLLGEVFDQIRALRAGEPTVLRAIDIYSPVLAEWRTAGIDDECTAFFESTTEAIRATAAAHGVTMVSVYDVLNGPDHDLDAVEAGYIGADGIHLSDAGGEAVGAALAAAGFDPS